ncbi:MAG TPA: tetratricopeptide repeat protein [Spirochaetota bacterium]|nr:tetratricopeptide repeat protein [Spirochaetota bacterium]
MKKFILFVIFITCSFVLPYYYHTEIYRFYLKFYYSHRYQGNEYMDRARKLYDEGKYAELREFAEPLLYVYMDNNELKRLTGMGMIRLGDELKGAELYTSGMENGKYNEFEAAKVIKTLYYGEAYGDVLYYYERKILRNNMDISYYYGVSLFRADRIDEAYEMFMNSKRGGYSDTQMLYYHIGLVLEKKKKYSEAAEYLVQAYSSGPADEDLVNALVRIYSTLGMYDRAEVLLRKKKN